MFVDTKVAARLDEEGFQPRTSRAPRTAAAMRAADTVALDTAAAQARPENPMTASAGA